MCIRDRTRVWPPCWGTQCPAPRRRASSSTSFMTKRRAGAAGTPERAGELHPERERAAARFGAGKRRRDAGVGAALPGAKDCHPRSGRHPHRELEAGSQTTYAGTTGYQPLLALWAELNVVVADEFRDGNVPAQQAPLPVTQRGFQALPKTVTERYFRGDSACDEDSLLTWLRDEKRADGPPGRIGFAVSARMHPALHQEIVATAEAQWQPYSEDSAAIKECAEVDYVPEESAENRYREPLRYVAIRIRKKQGMLFADGSAVKHFAVISNRWDWTPKKLLQWHREKAGSIEAVHDVIKNELAGGVMPCGRFGANAAWLRLAVLTYNVLTALKRLALPAELITARPKRLRFLIFCTPGKLVHHARRTLLRLARSWQRFSNWHYALRLLPLPAYG